MLCDLDDIRNCPHCRQRPGDRTCRAWERARQGVEALHRNAKRIAREVRGIPEATAGCTAMLHEFLDGSVSYFALEAPPWWEAGELTGDALHRALQISKERGVLGGKAAGAAGSPTGTAAAGNPSRARAQPQKPHRRRRGSIEGKTNGGKGMSGFIHWQQLALEDIERDQPPHLRISSAGRCPRALGYAAQGIPESNPPGPQARSRMALGHMAEVLIIRELEQNGWETRHTVLSGDGQLELELEVPDTGGETIKGHPDGICRHEKFTNNLCHAGVQVDELRQGRAGAAGGHRQRLPRVPGADQPIRQGPRGALTGVCKGEIVATNRTGSPGFRPKPE